MRAAQGGLLACLTGILLAAWAQADAPVAPRVVSTELQSRTDRYGHDVLGGNEYARLRIDYFPGGTNAVSTASVVLAEDRVFEDIEARIVDLTGDGFAEIAVVESSRAGGAELAIYGVGRAVAAGAHLDDDAFRKIAATPPIGRRNRWLAPAGIADFDGDGQIDIAYVETPHIGGTLRVWTMRKGRLVQIASKNGFSNHRIGEDFITGGVRDCGQGAELVLPNFDWSRLLVATLSGGKITARPLGPQTGPAAVGAALACND